MWNDRDKLDIYQYVRTNPYLIRFIGFLGVISVLMMAYGFSFFVRIHIIYAIIFIPVIAAIVFNKFIRYFIQIFYPRFDIRTHQEFVKSYWFSHREPAVDIFLPYAGEDLDVHEAVVKAATQLRYSNYKVYMLDDSQNPGHKALARKYGCEYLSRPNKGEWKKSGNLEYGYAHSQGEFIFILDADFVPARNALREIVPYIATDPRIGILQTPQYFEQNEHVHKRSPIEFGGGNIVEDFYRIILPCRDEFGAAMCVGTSAFYRRAVIEKLNGTPKVHASEDLATGLLITQFGYYVKYVPLIVSIGTSPDTFQGYFKQHQRWCSGNLVFAEYWPKARLPLLSRLVYLMNPTYYFAEAFSILFAFQFLILLYFHADSLSLMHTLYFLPYMIVSRIVVPVAKVNKSRAGTRLAALNNSYTYLYSLLSMAAKNIPQWHPTGLKINGLHPDFLNANKLGVFLSSLFIATFTFVIVSKPSVFGNYNTYAILLWSLYTVFWHTMYLTMVGAYIKPIHLPTVSNYFERIFLYARAHATLSLFAVLCAAFAVNVHLTSRNPATPTAVALAQLSGRDIPENAVAIDRPRPSSLIYGESSVLSATDTLPRPGKYVYRVEQEDTLESVAANAVDDYADEREYTLTLEQRSLAIEKLMEHISLHTILYSGDMLFIEPEYIEEAVRYGVEFTP